MRGKQDSSPLVTKDVSGQQPRAALDRRDFFKAAGLSSAAIAAAGLGLGAMAGVLGGCSPAESGTSGATQDSPDETYYLYGDQNHITFAQSCDVLIVGSGIAGLSAALPLAQAGKSVIVAEKLDLLGGTAVNSGGLMFVAGTEVQKQAGLSETPDEAWEKRVQILKALNIPHLERARELYLGATEWVNVLVDQCGSSFENPAEYWLPSDIMTSEGESHEGESQDTSKPESSETSTDAIQVANTGDTGSDDETATSEESSQEQGESSAEASREVSAGTPDEASTESSNDASEKAPQDDTLASQPPSGASSHPSFLLPRNGIGSMINVMSPLRDTLTSLGVTFLTSHQAKAFIVNSKGEKRGMRFLVNKPDSTVDIKAQSIIIASGGFASNPAFVHKYAPTWDQVGSYDFSQTGDGQRLCSDADIALSGMEEHVYVTGDVPWTDGWIYFGPTLIVSALGQRFAREDAATSAAATCFKNGLGYWWTIFDNQLVKSSQGRSIAELVNKYPQRVIGPVNSKEELAKAMGLADSALDQSFNDYEALVKAGNDTAFGRTESLTALAPPFYAIKQRPVRFASAGGISTDAVGHVLTGMGVASKNVYACGAVADGGGEGIASCGACGLRVGRTALADLG